jgi:hypothetical protein
MRPSTVDLLRIRDGEPVDVAVREAVEADTALNGELRRLTDVRRALEALPSFDPPPTAWPEIEARVVRHGADVRGVRGHWLLRGGLAACVAVAALAYLLHSQAPLPEQPQATVVASPTSQGSPALGTATYASLVEQSAELERALDGLGREPRVVRAGTLATVASLEGRIDAIDTRLTFARQLGLENTAVASLHRQRVELMNALLQVRYADQMRHVDAAYESDLRRFAY